MKEGLGFETNPNLNPVETNNPDILRKLDGLENIVKNGNRVEQETQIENSETELKLNLTQNLANKLNEIIDGNETINIDKLKEILGLLFDIKNLNTVICLNDGFVNIEGDYIKDEDIAILNQMKSSFNPKNIILESNGNNYILLGNHLIIIQGEMKYDSELVESIIKIHKAALCYMVKDIEEKKFKKKL